MGPEEHHKMSKEAIRPDHYAVDGVECIEAVKAAFTKEEFEGFCKGNVFKYLWRHRQKDNPTLDVEKAHQYFIWLRNSLAGQPLEISK